MAFRWSNASTTSLPQVVGDSHQLQQVFLNILNNAYDAVRECWASRTH